MRIRPEIIALLLIVAVIAVLAALGQGEEPASTKPKGAGAKQLPDTSGGIQSVIQHLAGAWLSRLSSEPPLYVITQTRVAHRSRPVSATGERFRWA